MLTNEILNIIKTVFSPCAHIGQLCSVPLINTDKIINMIVMYE